MLQKLCLFSEFFSVPSKPFVVFLLHRKIKIECFSLVFFNGFHFLTNGSRIYVACHQFLRRWLIEHQLVPKVSSPQLFLRFFFRIATRFTLCNICFISFFSPQKSDTGVALPKEIGEERKSDHDEDLAGETDQSDRPGPDRRWTVFGRRTLAVLILVDEHGIHDDRLVPAKAERELLTRAGRIYSRSAVSVHGYNLWR